MLLTHHLLPLTQGSHHVQRYARRSEEGVYIRDQVKQDACELQESRHWTKDDDFRDQVVLDVGAGVGTFAALVVLRRAAHVLAIEPDESRFTCLQFNGNPGIRPVRARLGARSGQSSCRWDIEGEETVQHGIVTLPMPQLLYVRPNFIKISAQGCEAAWTTPLPPYVRRVLLRTDDQGLTMVPRLTALMPGLQARIPYVQFPWSRATWVDFRRNQ